MPWYLNSPLGETHIIGNQTRFFGTEGIVCSVTRKCNLEPTFLQDSSHLPEVPLITAVKYTKFIFIDFLWCILLQFHLIISMLHKPGNPFILPPNSYSFGMIWIKIWEFGFACFPF